MKKDKPAAKPDASHGAPAVDPNESHHPAAPPVPNPAPPHPGGKGQEPPRARPRISEHGRGRSGK